MVIISDPSAVGGFCRTNEHCVNIQHAECYDNSTCHCHYKYKHSQDGTTCLPGNNKYASDNKIWHCLAIKVVTCVPQITVAIS